MRKEVYRSVRRKCAAFCLIFLLSAVGMLLIGCRLAVNDREDGNYSAVIDDASVISPETEEYISRCNSLLESACGAQICIVTKSSLLGRQIEQYTENLFQELGVGSSSKDNGVLFLMAIGEDDYWALEGKGLEKTLSGGELGTILDQSVGPLFSAQNYDESARTFFDEVLKRLCALYGLSFSSIQNQGAQNGELWEENGSRWQEEPTGSGSLSSFFLIPVVYWIIRIAVILLILRVIFGVIRRAFGFGGRGGIFFWHRPPMIFPPRPPFGFRRHGAPPPPRGGGFDPRPGGFGGGFSRGGFRGGNGSPPGGGFGSRPSGFGGTSHRSSFRGGGGSSRGGGAGRGRR